MKRTTSAKKRVAAVRVQRQHWALGTVGSYALSGDWPCRQHDQEPQWRFVGVLVKHDAAGGVIPREELD
jgi:hypothetical protein